MKISALMYAIVIISFFMPFFMVSCEKTELMTIKGIQLVTGGKSELKVDNLFAGMGDNSEKEQKPQKISAHPLAIIAIAVAVLALLSSFLLPRKMYFVPVIFSIMGVVFLYLLKGGMAAMLAKADTGMGSALDLSKMLRVSPLYGFWVANAAFLGGALISLFLGIKKKEEPLAIPLSADAEFIDPMAVLPEDYLPETEFTDTEVDDSEDIEQVEENINKEV
ncbi:MAG: hypothetical protein PHY48_03805 [Candidatus Cloacimonetes bacterium]|nr:hypothetical protein [Candidatus Cloacimonadota bacterium]